MNLRLTNCRIQIDAEDRKKLSWLHWRDNGKGSIVAILDKKSVYIGRYLLDCIDPKLEVDHVDRNIYNNKKENLRIVTKSINNQNRNIQPHSSTYRGVSFSKKSNFWIAMIQVNKKSIRIGRFKKEYNAALAYNLVAVEYFGELAAINLIG